jgi:uncharacterized repeat protein (TIGR01451 family)
LTGASYGNDVYGNDAAYCVDDGIEFDYNQANVRVWRNRVMNTRRGVSVQPIRGGPAYIFRNEFFNQENVPIKMHNFTTGFFVIHNTGAKHGEGHGDNGQMWRNAVFRNNLFLGTEYAFTFITVADEGFRDLDYNGWGTTRSPTDPYFKWDNVRYDRITDLPPGVEDHGVEAVFADLVNPVLPADWNVAAVPGTRDLRLRADVAEIDAGTELANFNDGFAIAGAPDLGAFEYGQPLPYYGPRPLTPDLGGSRKLVSRSSVDFGNRVNYTIILQNSGTPLTSTVTMTDTIPAGLTYVPGSLAASLGTVDDSAVPTLSWTGSLADEVLVTITYAVTVTESETRFITNSATFEAGPAGRFTRTARVLVNGQVIHLPLIRKG